MHTYGVAFVFARHYELVRNKHKQFIGENEFNYENGSTG